MKAQVNGRNYVKWMACIHVTNAVHALSLQRCSHNLTLRKAFPKRTNYGRKIIEKPRKSWQIEYVRLWVRFSTRTMRHVRGACLRLFAFSFLAPAHAQLEDISITAHDGAIRGLMEVIDAPPRGLPTGGDVFLNCLVSIARSEVRYTRGCLLCSGGEKNHRRLGIIEHDTLVCLTVAIFKTRRSRKDVQDQGFMRALCRAWKVCGSIGEIFCSIRDSGKESHHPHPQPPCAYG